MTPDDGPEKDPGEGQNPFKGTPFEQFFSAMGSMNLPGMGGPGGRAACPTSAPSSASSSR